jgi:phosphopantothenoylcysteine decarboxylase / phosphopantothenate---cysteine ligase
MSNPKRTKLPRVLLAVTGCAQAEHTPRLVANLLHHPETGSHRVIVAATQSALQFFERAEVEKLTGTKLFVNHADATTDFPVPHINLIEWADVLIVYPASANTIAKCAHGICDTLVSSLVLSANCPVYFGPSMNEAMYDKAITQRNLKILEELGHQVIEREMAKVWIHAKQDYVEKLFCTESMVLSVCERMFS